MKSLLIATTFSVSFAMALNSATNATCLREPNPKLNQYRTLSDWYEMVLASRRVIYT